MSEPTASEAHDEKVTLRTAQRRRATVACCRRSRIRPESLPVDLRGRKRRRGSVSAPWKRPTCWPRPRVQLSASRVKIQIG